MKLSSCLLDDSSVIRLLQIKISCKRFSSSSSCKFDIRLFTSPVAKLLSPDIRRLLDILSNIHIKYIQFMLFFNKNPMILIWASVVLIFFFSNNFSLKWYFYHVLLEHSVTLLDKNSADIMPKIWFGAENFVCRNCCPPKIFVRRKLCPLKIISAEVLSDQVYRQHVKEVSQCSKYWCL